MAHYRAAQRAERTRFRHRVEYVLMRGLVAALGRLPLPLAMWSARRLGEVAFDVLRIRRRVTLENLRLSVGRGWTEGELIRIGRSTYRNFGMSFIEFALFGRTTLKDMEKRFRFVNFDAVRRVCDADRGIIYLTSHTGNWEWVGACIALEDRPISVVVGDQKNLLVDGYLKRLRALRGMTLIPIGTALRECLRTLRAGGRLGLIADQDGGRDGMFIDFFGRPASTAVGPARFAYRTNAAVVMLFDHFVGGGRHETIVYEPILPDPSQPEDQEIRRILTEYHRRLESFIETYPDSWLWMHRRWKTRPSSEMA